MKHNPMPLIKGPYQALGIAIIDIQLTLCRPIHCSVKLIQDMFKPHWRHNVLSLGKNINPSLVLVQPRKTRPFITERLLMGRKESNQTNKQIIRDMVYCIY